MLECVINVSEGRDPSVVDAIRSAAGPACVDVHSDLDHHRSVFTLASDDSIRIGEAARQLATKVAQIIDLRQHAGVHPRFGAVYVVPFVALGTTPTTKASTAAHSFAIWWAEEHDVPVFFYGDLDPQKRPL